MNSALQSYIDLTETLCKLCQVENAPDYLDCVNNLVRVVQKVDEYRFFPLDLNSEFVNSLKTTEQDWQTDRAELSRQLYVALATLMYRFEASNISNRSYFYYMLEYARTSLPYEIVKDWGKEYVEDMHFSHEGFFFALNRITQSYKSKREFNEYRKKLSEMIMPNRPVEKAIPDRILQDMESCYNKYYNDYCDSIERLYPEIKELFLNYNMHLRIYLCSYNICEENPKIDFVLAYFYKDNKRRVTVFPYYVDLAYRFCNIEDIKEQLVDGNYCIFRFNEDIYNFTDISSIYYRANQLFVGHAKPKTLCEYLCYFLRGQLKEVKVLSDEQLLCEHNTFLLCGQDTSFDRIVYLQQTIPNIHFVFTVYPSAAIVEYLKSKDVAWSLVSQYGTNMINNDNANMVHWFIRNNLNELSGVRIEKGANLLIEKLNHCECGNLYWHDFELIGTEIFEYIFKDAFYEYQSKLQSTTNDKIQRRDLVVNNNFNDQTSFWGRMHSQFGCKMIIVDFKNYSNEIDSDCLFNVTKYMTNNTGHFVLVFSRKGVCDSGRIEQLRLFRDNKLVLCLSDRDLVEMIQLKQANKNPYIVLDQLLFSLMQNV